MSKSLGNFLTIDDVLKKYDANTIRFFILTNHYRMPVEFSDEALSSAATGIKRLYNAVNEARKTLTLDETLNVKETKAGKLFEAAMDEDLNTSKALAVLFDLATELNKNKNREDYTVLYKLASVLGFNFDKKEISEDELKEKVEKLSQILDKNLNSIDELIEMRKNARAEKDWALADKIRNATQEVGIVLKDGKEGTTWEVK